jgi:hypothetical protein
MQAFAGVFTEEVAGVVLADTPEGAVTASTKPPNVPTTILSLQCFIPIQFANISRIGSLLSNTR